MTRTPSEGFGLEDDRDDLPFQIHHELDDAPLSVWAFRVYAHLVRRSGRDGKIFPSYQTIGETCFRSTYGPTANPKSLRNKAMAAMKELIEVGLVTKIERTRKSSLQNDTNTYQLTPRRKWLGELKEKRAELATETEATQKVMRVQRIENRAVRKLTKLQETARLLAEAETRQKTTAEPEQRGAEPDVHTDLVPTEEEAGLGGDGIPTVPRGTPTMPPHGIPTMPRGTPTVPEVISTEVLQSFEVISKEGGGFSSTENARAESQTEPHAPSVAVLEPPASTTTDDAALKPQHTQTAPEGLSAVEAGTPDGVIEDALKLTDEDAEMLFGGQDENAKSVEQVPGAAAGRAALSGLVGTASIPAAEELLPPVTVDLLRAIPEAELLGRPAAEPSDAIYKTIVGFVGGKRVIEEGILDGNTPSGGVPRRYWLRLTSDDLDLIRRTAQVEAKATKKSFLTLCILGMDRLIGASRRPDKAPPSALGQAYDSPQVQEQRAAELAVRVGSTWLGRKSGKPYLIEESNGKSVFVQDLGEYPLVKFHQQFVAAE